MDVIWFMAVKNENILLTKFKRKIKKNHGHNSQKATGKEGVFHSLQSNLVLNFNFLEYSMLIAKANIQLLAA
ncbi:hypothetical protein BCY86_03870 [Pajaroellobacter abortibovis]|uniref:Uncharacterized protein n=1 Tax=Pajaroellobacter abortibovis TaxID=1882918 RepID=A0A1L6MWK0_9BACT|nr:hypothetical protein BCY86_03870 [Pajaroellobacter abortibovis]